ncbi:MAG: hypothetical protein ROZ00_13125 [Denitratisoma sp.]|nr:hypothetical protein [Denitratisoma sp.]
MTHAQSDDFDIAKAIFDQLKDLPSERQQRVLRWIAEGLGVSSAAPQAPPHGSSVPTNPAALPVLPLVGNAGATDIKTFIAGKSPKSDQQFAAAVAYYYRFEAPPAERRDSVNGDVLQEAARLAGRKRPANPRVTLNNAKAAGYLDSSSPGDFTINSVGENLVAMTLPGGTEAPTKKKRQTKKQATTKSKTKRR